MPECLKRVQAGAILGTTPRETVIFANILEQSSRHLIEVDDVAMKMGITYVKSLTYEPELKSLEGKKLIRRNEDKEILVPAFIKSALARNKVKDIIFAEIGGGGTDSNESNGMNTIKHSEIVAKALFYNKENDTQVTRLKNLIEQENYRKTCGRLKDRGLRTGFTCLFYGSPGTGKTETVYQLARQTGRDIFLVNVPDIKSCWVGESEKNIKGLFDQYRKAVGKSAVAPILLFNEADAIFGIRQEGATRAVDKMENSIQNIILQEMEKLDGILIATTNLTRNLDKAFERRFLYKIRFDTPDENVKEQIWASMLPTLSEEEAKELAHSFDFSGGQIENIVRKKEIKFIIDGVDAGMEEIRDFCREELIENADSGRKRIGFR